MFFLSNIEVRFIPIGIKKFPYWLLTWLIIVLGPKDSRRIGFKIRRIFKKLIMPKPIFLICIFHISS